MDPPVLQLPRVATLSLQYKNKDKLALYEPYRYVYNGSGAVATVSPNLGGEFSTSRSQISRTLLWSSSRSVHTNAGRGTHVVNFSSGQPLDQLRQEGNTVTLSEGEGVEQRYSLHPLGFFPWPQYSTVIQTWNPLWQPFVCLCNAIVCFRVAQRQSLPT